MISPRCLVKFNKNLVIGMVSTNRTNRIKDQGVDFEPLIQLFTNNLHIQEVGLSTKACSDSILQTVAQVQMTSRQGVATVAWALTQAGQALQRLLETGMEDPPFVDAREEDTEETPTPTDPPPAATEVSWTCPLCDDPQMTIRRAGRGGIFWGCRRYPECRGTRSYRDPTIVGPVRLVQERRRQQQEQEATAEQTAASAPKSKAKSKPKAKPKSTRAKAKARPQAEPDSEPDH